MTAGTEVPFPSQSVGLGAAVTISGCFRRRFAIGLVARYGKPNWQKSFICEAAQGFGGAGVLEVVDDFDGNTYRAVYTVRFAEIVYVLHAFQKKSTRGIATPAREIRVIQQRLQRAREDYEAWQASSDRIAPIAVTKSTGNVFADLGVAHPGEELVKANSSATSAAPSRGSGLPSAGGTTAGARPAKVSALINGDSRLLQRSTPAVPGCLGQDVEIVVRSVSRGRERGQIRVVAAA